MFFPRAGESWRSGENARLNNSLSARFISFNCLKYLSVCQDLYEVEQNFLVRLLESILTDSIKEDATAACVTPPILMLARTGAPKPIEESCRLFYFTK